MLLAAQPPIVHDPIPFGARRKAEMRAYARRHYGINTALLKNPKVIVEHVTVTSTYRATWNTFAPDVPDAELHELPGTCAHFVVDRAGKIHQLVSLRYMRPPRRASRLRASRWCGRRSARRSARGS